MISLVNLKMQVWAGYVACIAHLSDHLAALYPIPLGNQELTAMRIARKHAVAMINQEEFTPGFIRLGEQDSAALRSHDIVAVNSAATDINSVMVFITCQVTRAEIRGDVVVAGQRPKQLLARGILAA